MLERKRIIEELEKATGITIEDRVLNIFAAKRVSSPSGSVEYARLVITDIILACEKDYDVAKATSNLTSRLTCPLCATDVGSYGKEQRDLVNGPYIVGDQHYCTRCLDRVNGREGDKKNIVGP